MLSLRLTWLSRTVYLISIAFIFLFILPVSWFPLQLGKIALFSILLSVASILFVLGGGITQLRGRRGLFLSLIPWLLPAVYALSWWFSIDKPIGLYGSSVESDTVLFSILCALAFSFSFVSFRAARSSQVFIKTLVGTILLAALFQALVVAFGTHAVPFSVFSDRSVNLIGKWNDFGLLAGLLVILLLGWVEFGHASLTRRLLAGAGIVVLAFLLAIVQFSLVWFLIAGFSILLAIGSFFFKRGASTMSLIPWIPLGASVVSILFVVWGVTFNAGLTSVFPVSSLEVRPSFTSTLSVTKQAHSTSLKRFLLGTGPDTFGEVWLIDKPAGVNQSPFWDTNFGVGYSTVLTTLETTGVVGVGVWLLPLLLVLFGLFRVLRTPSPKERPWVFVLAGTTLYMWCSMLFYVPSQDLILFAFIVAGAAFAASVGGGEASEMSDHRSFPIGLSWIGYWLAIVVFIVLALWTTIISIHRFAIESYVNQGNALLNSGNAAGALAMAAKAQAIEKTPDALNLGVSAGLVTLQNLTNQTKPSPQTQQQFVTQVQQTIALGKESITADPGNYQSYLSLANVYDLLSSLGISGAYQSAGQTYLAAASYNPMDPEIPLAIARLGAVHGDAQVTQQYLSAALTLKPDYTDAILFLVQLDVAQNDIPSAIVAAQAAVKSAPGVPSLWFELGLLYYTKGDTADAVTVLQQAVKLEPDYANAKYFLGLSYAAQNDLKDAVAQFSDLAQSNPDNTEVALILGNLETGKPPFTGAQPPVTATPQSRQTAPVSQ